MAPPSKLDTILDSLVEMSASASDVIRTANLAWEIYRMVCAKPHPFSPYLASFRFTRHV